MITIPAAGISLFVTACISGTLHGEARTLCHEFQIRSYPSVEACDAMHAKALKEWAAGMALYNLQIDIKSSRCAPAEREGDDP